MGHAKMTTRQFRPCSGVLETEIGADLSLYHPGREEVTLLNQTAADVWRLLDGTTPLGEIVDLLATAYQTLPEEITGDIEATIVRLVEAGLVEESR